MALTEDDVRGIAEYATIARVYEALHDDGVPFASIMEQLHVRHRKGRRMALTEDDVRGIAEYATIALDETELAEMTAYLNDAVDMLEPVLQLATASSACPPSWAGVSADAALA